MFNFIPVVVISCRFNQIWLRTASLKVQAGGVFTPQLPTGREWILDGAVGRFVISQGLASLGGRGVPFLRLIYSSPVWRNDVKFGSLVENWLKIIIMCFKINSDFILIMKIWLECKVSKTVNFQRLCNQLVALVLFLKIPTPIHLLLVDKKHIWTVNLRSNG